MHGSGWHVLPAVLSTQRQSLARHALSELNEQPRIWQRSSVVFHWHWLSLAHALGELYTQVAEVQVPFTRTQFGSRAQSLMLSPVYLNSQSRMHTPLCCHVQYADTDAQSDDERKRLQAGSHLSWTTAQTEESQSDAD
jgi:hypothetical protein